MLILVFSIANHKVNKLEMKGNTLTIVLLVVGLIVRAGGMYVMSPSSDGGDAGDGTTGSVTVEALPLEGKTVQLGYISSTTAGLETTTPLVKDIMEVDYKEYLEKLGYDVDIEYLIDDATG